MTPATALVRARGIFGPSAFVHRDAAPPLFHVGDGRRGLRLIRGSGNTWEEALEEAERDAFGVTLRFLPEELEALLSATLCDASRSVSQALREALSAGLREAHAKVAALDARRRRRK